MPVEILVKNDFFGVFILFFGLGLLIQDVVFEADTDEYFLLAVSDFWIFPLILHTEMTD